jgi:hypothetical protein
MYIRFFHLFSFFCSTLSQLDGGGGGGGGGGRRKKVTSVCFLFSLRYDNH